MAFPSVNPVRCQRRNRSLLFSGLFTRSSIAMQHSDEWRVVEGLEPDRTRVNSTLPVGRIADYLESLSRERAWLAVLLGMTALAWADSRCGGVGLAPLYIPVICAACWTLGERAGLFVAIVAAILAVVPHFADPSHPPLLLLGARIGVRVATYLFVTAIVVSFRRSFDRERYMALRDSLTDALNKETFRKRAIDVLNAAAPAGQILVLALLDLDDFKSVNTRHGHVAGDAVLRAFAQGACDIIRREDDFGRIGGDEFAFLIPVPSAADGRRLAATLHARLSKTLAEREPPVTCSMGALVISPDAPRDEASMMQAVDQLMYAVKRAGKNAVQIAEAGKVLEATGAEPRRGARRLGAVR
jgi:diguanylate cyclase (GGDEF)-like protein